MTAADSLDLAAAALLFAASIGAWTLAAALRPGARLYLRFAAVLLSTLAISMPLQMAGVTALLLLPLAFTSLMISALARFMRPLPAALASAALILALAGGFSALLSGIGLLALAPAMIAGLAVIAAAMNSLALMPMLAGASLLAASLAFLEQGAEAGLLLFCAAALVGLAKPQLLRSSSSGLEAQRALP